MGRNVGAFKRFEMLLRESCVVAISSGIFGIRGAGVRGELKQKLAACLNHYAVADPAAVSTIEHELRRYERLRDAAGIDQRFIEQPSHLLPGPLAPLQAAAEGILGLVPALFGLVTSGAPYLLSRAAARRAACTHRATSLSLGHILVGAVAFPLFYGLEVAWVWVRFSTATTLAFALLLVPAGLFAWLWWRRMKTLAVNLGGRAASWMKLDAVARRRGARRTARAHGADTSSAIARTCSAGSLSNGLQPEEAGAGAQACSRLSCQDSMRSKLVW